MTKAEIEKEIERLERWIFFIEMADRRTWEEYQQEKECERKICELKEKLAEMN